MQATSSAFVFMLTIIIGLCTGGSLADTSAAHAVLRTMFTTFLTPDSQHLPARGSLAHARHSVACAHVADV